MTNSVRTGLAVAAMMVILGGPALAQGVSVGTQTRGSGHVGVGSSGARGSFSGSNRMGGHATAPGAGAGINSQTTGQGSVGVGRGGVGSHLGAGSNAGAGVKVGR
jgi:hypothetical protein